MRVQHPPSPVRWTLTSLLLCLTSTVGGRVAIAAGDDMSDLQARASRFWNARVQEDWKTVHALMPPEELAIAGDADTFAAYQKERGPLRYADATIHDVVVERDLGWVHVTFASSPRLYPKLPATRVDTWQVWQRRDDWRPVARSLLDQFPTRPPKARPSADEARLAARVNEEWEAMRADDWARVYRLLEPSYRAATPRDVFLARKARYRYLNHTVEWTEVTDDRGRVKLSYTRKLNDPTLYKIDPEDLVAFENWRRVDGEWFRDLERPRGSH